MGTVTPNIGIFLPDAGEKNYAASFAAGMINVDQHDHSGAPNKGLPISSAGIDAGAITYTQLNANVADNTTGIGTATGPLANQLKLLGLISSLYGLGSPSGILSASSGVAAALPSASQTFTPQLQFGGANVGMTTSLAKGKCWQIGSMVFFFLIITLTAKGSSTGTARVTGLPFTAANDGYGSLFIDQSSINNYPSGVTYMSHGIAPNTSIVNLYGNGNANARTALTDAAFANTDQLQVAGFYWTS